MIARIVTLIGAGFLTFAAQAQDTRTVTEPALPPVCAALTAKLASPESEGTDTARIQQAIHDCPAGQAVRLAAGSGRYAFLSGPLILKSGVTLLIDAGVTLYATTDPHAYDRGKGSCGSNDGVGHGCAPFITADDTEGSGIMGGGAIDGQGGHRIDGKKESWWQIARRAQKENTRQNVPRLIEINRSRSFTLYGITLLNSANFHVAFTQVDGFTAWGVRIDTPADARNTDGIDPISSRNITIAESYIRTGDDNVAIKAGRLGAVENVSILRNHFYSGHGMSIGSETDGGVRHVLVENLSMDGTTSGLRIKSDVSRGGLVEDVRYRDVCLREVRAPLDVDTHYDARASGDRLPVYSGISLEHVHSLTGGRLILRGLDEAHTLAFAMNDVVFDGNPSLQMAHARVTQGPGPLRPLPTGENVRVSGTAGEADVKSKGLNCAERFAPFPARIAPAPAQNPDRPQLSDAGAAAYSYAEVLSYSPAKGNKTSDPWDPLADPIAGEAMPTPDYIVDLNGPADGTTHFRSVQEAVIHALAETGRTKRVFILIKPGVYRELVYVPEFSAPITLIGAEADANRTRISVDLDANVSGRRYEEHFAAQFANAPPGIAAMFDSVKKRDIITTFGTGVLWVRNHGFQAKNLSIDNTYNRAHGDAFNADGSPAIHSQAVALMLDDADKTQFENIRLSSYQDTLYFRASSPDKTARSFFNRSYIEGDVDFIFGEATAYFRQTEIKSLGDRRVSYVAAPDTPYATRFGIVFDSCKFTHDNTPNALAGKFYLGRQWFHNQKCTPFGNVSSPAGYRCEVGPRDSYDPPRGTVSRDTLETVGKVIILNSEIGAHIDKQHPWSDWNAAGTIKHRPAQYSSDDFWNNLLKAGIDPVKQLGYVARKVPAEPFLAEYHNRDE